MRLLLMLPPLNSLLLISFLITCILIIFVVLVRWFVDRKWWEQQQYLKVPEVKEWSQQENPFYRRVLLYVNTLPSLQNVDFTNILSGEKPNDIVLSADDDQVIADNFLGCRVSWVKRIERDDQKQIVCRSLVLRMRRKDKQRILRPYLRHINTVCDEMEQMGKKEMRIHMNKAGKWISVAFHHPASFESLVMDPDLKSRIQLELETFQRSKQYYKRLGRVWKRSYLLYGPSGTGKSSFIAAVANFLNYDVYNVNLSQIADDADLGWVLVRSSCKSLIVVEDLDRYVVSSSGVTSSGLLNFMDGILNFEEERIMIFTASNKEGIDSALLRPGRIDVHIHFPLISNMNSFKSLASNYLGVKEHKLFPQLEEMFESGATMSPAEISELMLVNRNSPSRALRSVITALQLQSSSSRCSRKSKVASLPNLLPPSPCAEEDAAGSADWKETLPKEFRKLYGLLSLKSTKRPAAASFDHLD